MKKILVVDDSALMRRVLCDIINSDERFHVEDRATNGLEAFDLLSRKSYDAVVLDVNMPKMNGLELLGELNKYKIPARVMMASTDTREGAKTTLDALELGALDFIHKPDSARDCRVEDFQKHMLEVLAAVAEANVHSFTQSPKHVETPKTKVEIQRMTPVAAKPVERPAEKTAAKPVGRKLVAIASSTGGPKALQSVIPHLPQDLQAPVLVVQHMPKGFTASLAERLDSLSHISVCEAAEGDVLENGRVYLAMGGKHMNVSLNAAGKYTIHYTDEPPREGVKPCANYMYESLENSRFDQIVCVVMTGMGADGTQGILHLKEKKKTLVIAQEQSTCAVYGMPKSVVGAGLSDKILPLEQIAQEIILNVGVK
ncbi:MAG: chemotaxis response regulator protein-glutamate methylesterase [Lachnospiraceae bacterium]|nr:chemotaxis response regulator protein-glutamate methylesterase [Lachnospiraceae bacterium]MBQ7780784.1 chemotaxis response regulator protein-glutamate methylesterase [Lachnospiraceae bacterium]